MASSRFHGKPLKPILGLSMIEHVRRRVALCSFLDDVIVATCDREIVEEVERFGGKAVMTSDRHEGCVDRVGEVAKNLKAEIVINVQGDMPLVHPETLESIVAPLLQEESLLCTDMMGPINNESEFNNPNVVKVVVDISGNALYYSREPIPFFKKVSSNFLIQRNKQFGINAFRREFLITYASLSRTPLERIESVDMLRVLEHGFHVRMVSTLHPVIGVDTPEDLEEAKRMMQRDQIFPIYIEK
jgi:3-deoxy-manno-octulosonate cytidylyltransferase (CMP-KDO synthetase)